MEYPLSTAIREGALLRGEGWGNIYPKDKDGNVLSNAQGAALEALGYNVSEPYPWTNEDLFVDDYFQKYMYSLDNNTPNYGLREYCWLKGMPTHWRSIYDCLHWLDEICMPRLEIADLLEEYYM